MRIVAGAAECVLNRGGNAAKCIFGVFGWEIVKRLVLFCRKQQ